MPRRKLRILPALFVIRGDGLGYQENRFIPPYTRNVVQQKVRGNQSPTQMSARLRYWTADDEDGISDVRLRLNNASAAWTEPLSSALLPALVLADSLRFLPPPRLDFFRT